MKKNKTGFTLIELIVVLGIIGVILSLSVLSLGGIKQGTRDMERVSDVKQIQAALELYRTNEGAYPSSITIGQALASASTTYLNEVPANPNPISASACTGSTYDYAKTTSGYTLEFCLEKNSGTLEAGVHCATPAGIKNGNCGKLVVSSLFAPEIQNKKSFLNQCLVIGENLYTVGSANNYGLFLNYDKATLGKKTMTNQTLGNGAGDSSHFADLSADTKNVVYLVGDTSISGAVQRDALIISDFNTAKLLSGTYDEAFYDATVVQDSYIYAVGSTNSEGAGDKDALIAKYDTSLRLQKAMLLGSTRNDDFKTVLSSSDGKLIYALGKHVTPTADGLIAVYDTNLALQNQQAFRYLNGAGGLAISRAIMDGDYIYAVGEVTDADGKVDAVILKIAINPAKPTEVSLVNFGVYGVKSFTESFSGISIADGKLYVSGNTKAEGAGARDGLILIFDTDLKLLSRNVYGGNKDDFYRALCLSGKTIYAVGYSEKGDFGKKDTLTTSISEIKNSTLTSLPDYFTWRVSQLDKAADQDVTQVSSSQQVTSATTLSEITIEYAPGTITNNNLLQDLYTTQ